MNRRKMSFDNPHTHTPNATPETHLSLVSLT